MKPQLLRKIGVGLLGLALLALCLNLVLWSLMALMGAGVISGYLAVRKQPTISQWIQDLIRGRGVDLAIMVGIFVLIWFIGGPVIFLWSMVGGLNVHFNGERW